MSMPIIISSSLIFSLGTFIISNRMSSPKSMFTMWVFTKSVCPFAASIRIVPVGIRDRAFATREDMQVRIAPVSIRAEQMTELTSLVGSSKSGAPTAIFSKMRFWIEGNIEMLFFHDKDKPILEMI